MDPYFFGNDDQKRMQRTAHWLWPLMRDDPVYGYGGRIVGVDDPSEPQIEAMTSLARVQGATEGHYIAENRESELTKAFVDQGLKVDRWDQVDGGESAIKACAQVVDRYSMPTGYRLCELTEKTQVEVLDRFSETALSCGVMPPATPVLTGQTRNGVAFYIEAPDGSVSACSGAVMRNHPSSAFSDASWWGMLATRDQDRGNGFSLYLGAVAAITMHRRYGAKRFYTGVRKTNDASRHICERLGLTYNGYVDLGILDPSLFAGGRYTA